jgi:hypothetical protein
LDHALAIAVYAEIEVTVEPFECFWLPFHIDIDPVVAGVEVHLDICVTILSGDL